MDEADLEKIAEIVRRNFPQFQALWLFGSFVEGAQDFQSDVDLALLLPPGEVANLFSKVREELSEALGRDVDLIDLRASATVFQNEIVSHGRTLLVNDPRAVEEFEMLSLSLWQKLNQERAGILEDIAQSGRILHG